MSFGARGSGWQNTPSAPNCSSEGQLMGEVLQIELRTSRFQGCGHYARRMNAAKSYHRVADCTSQPRPHKDPHHRMPSPLMTEARASWDVCVCEGSKVSGYCGGRPKYLAQKQTSAWVALSQDTLPSLVSHCSMWAPCRTDEHLHQQSLKEPYVGSRHKTLGLASQQLTWLLLRNLN